MRMERGCQRTDRTLADGGLPQAKCMRGDDFTKNLSMCAHHSRVHSRCALRSRPSTALTELRCGSGCWSAPTAWAVGRRALTAGIPLGHSPR